MIEKKNPLIMPPDINELPAPDDKSTQSNNNAEEGTFKDILITNTEEEKNLNPDENRKTFDAAVKTAEKVVAN